MSAPLPTTLRPTHPDATQGVEGFPSAPFNVAQGMIYPSMYPFPGLLQPPVAPFPNSPPFVMPPFPMGPYGINYAPTFQGHSTVTSPDFALMNKANPWASRFPFNGALAQNAISAANHQLSRFPGHYQPSPLVTFQSSFPTQPEAASNRQQRQHPFQILQEDPAAEKPSKQPTRVRRKPKKDPRAAHVAPAVYTQGYQMNNRVHPGQQHLNAVQEDLAVKKPLNEPGEVHGKDYKHNKDPRLAQVAPTLCLQGDQTNNQVHALEKTLSVHTCFNNPDSACSRRGTICLDSFHTLNSEGPVILSDEQMQRYIFASLFPELCENQPTSQPLQVDTTDPPPIENTPSSWETASSSSNTVDSSPGSVHSSLTGSSLSTPKQPQAIASSSISSTSRSAGKRQRSEDYSEGRPKKQQRKDTYVWGDENHLEACNNKLFDCIEEPHEKHINLEYVCRICMIHAKLCQLFSGEDALKCHIESMHNIYQVLLCHEELNILKPQQKDRFQNLVPLIRFCITLQLQAQQCGMKITPEWDLTILYPNITAFLHHS